MATNALWDLTSDLAREAIKLAFIGLQPPHILPRRLLQVSRDLTSHNVSASAGFAHNVLAAEETDADPLTDFHPYAQLPYLRLQCGQRLDDQERAAPLRLLTGLALIHFWDRQPA